MIYMLVLKIMKSCKAASTAAFSSSYLFASIGRLRSNQKHLN